MSHWIDEALERNHQRRRVRFEEGRAGGAAWMLECRDMWDAHDEDGGVYFLLCADEDEESTALARMPSNGPNDRVLGIYDLRHPLEAQGAGLMREEWLAGRR